MPDSIDSGHPPTFGLYLAFLWKIFGRSLFISHAAMLPFIFLIIFQAIKLGENLFPENRKFSWFLTAIVLSETVLLAQCTLVSPDILVVGFFLFALNSILKNNKRYLTIAIMVMGVLSMRAMMSSLALYFFSLAYSLQSKESRAMSYYLQKIIAFVPGGLLSFLFFSFHYYKMGWIGYHSSSPWASSFQLVPGSDFVRNLIFLFWRILDLGKAITVIIALIFVLLWFFRKEKYFITTEKRTINALLILALCLFFLTAFPLCFYANLLAHRYIIPFYFSVSILAVYLLGNSKIKYKTLIFSLIFLVQLSGHFWNYPRRISQGWDCSLALLPYYPMRVDFQNYIIENKIPKNEIGANFTLVNSDFAVNLKGDPTSYGKLGEDSVSYIWYSNVENSILDDHFDDYFKNWEILKQENKGNVQMILFKKK